MNSSAGILRWDVRKMAWELSPLSRDKKISGRVEAKQIRHLKAGGVEQPPILAFGALPSTRFVGQQHEQIFQVRTRGAREVIVQHRFADQERSAGRQCRS